MKRHTVVALILVLSVAVFLTPQLHETNAQQNIPLLAVVKYTEKESVVVNETVTVYVEIKNIGNETAYNVTLIDEYPEWAFDVLDKGGESWGELNPNETVITFYKVRIKNFVTGYYSLGKAKVIYFDSKGNKYTSFSNEVWLAVIYYGSAPVNVKSVWRNTAIFVGLIVLSIVTPLLFLEYRFYQSYKREVEEEKKR